MYSWGLWNLQRDMVLWNPGIVGARNMPAVDGDDCRLLWRVWGRLSCGGAAGEKMNADHLALVAVSSPPCGLMEVIEFLISPAGAGEGEGHYGEEF